MAPRSKLRKEDYVYIRVPIDAWDTISETLAMDAQSSAFDKNLREEISEAHESVEFFPPDQIEEHGDFTVYGYADVSTGHITENDGKLMGAKGAPGVVAQLTGDTGTIFHTGVDLDLMKDFGFSRYFISIIRKLRVLKVPYVRFDAEGEMVDGLRTFEW